MVIRKRIIELESQQVTSTDQTWLDVEQLAQVEVTSEDTEFPIESALVAGSATGWRAASEGEQAIRLLFDSPQKLGCIRLDFIEETQQRTQEFVLKWSSDGGKTWHDIVRQQYNFSPPDAVRELEEYHVELDSVTTLELRIIPEISGGGYATLAQMRIG
jgi:hypothetical protein